MAAIWRNRDIEQIVGGPLDKEGFSVEGIARLVESVPDESEVVEYKDKGGLQKNPGSRATGDTWNEQQEHAKDICAPANGRGAVMIWGVTDKTKEPAKDRLKPFYADAGSPYELIDRFKKEVRRYATPIPLFDMFPVQADERFYVVAVIPPSVRKPHAVTGKRGALHFFVRSTGESHIREMSENEVADQYYARHTIAAARAVKLDDVWQSGVDKLLGRGERLWVVAAIVPDAPGDSLLTRATRREITDWIDSTRFPDLIFFDGVLSGEVPIANQGMLEVEGAAWNGSASGVDTIRHLYVDGSGFAAVMLRDRGEAVVDGNLQVEADDFVDAAAAGIGHLVQHAVARAGAYGNATVRIGLADGKYAKGVFKAPAVITGLGGRSRGLPRPANGYIQTEQVVHLDAAQSASERLQIAHSLLSPIMQRFGYIEPHLITDGGAIRDPRFTERQRREAVQGWADLHGVDIDRTSGWEP
ncbi:AlbA family DNA-binding domain-containing protein [Nocardia farcinica]|uniref:AlbA family DNA-binding domain-containing protein n=1 Tax=Nocardia farcinica TaxID=37329 RepID=UPI002453D720|nr:ATP-binding protein [Nocardia farcinica]